MKFEYGKRRRALEYEKALVDFWKKNKTFEKSVEQRSDDYVFYDGPPFITGSPHHGTLLSSIVKDAVPRYWTMRGRRVERRWGWDCHGLPAENFTEKHLGGTVSRKPGGRADELQLKIGDEVSDISLEEYVKTARDLMVANSETWENTIDRIGRWVDFKGSYKTMDKDFMESVWWAFAELYKKGKIYEGKKVLMYDTTFQTPVSKNEVTMDNDAYQTVTDPSVYVKFLQKYEYSGYAASYVMGVGDVAALEGMGAKVESKGENCEVLIPEQKLEEYEAWVSASLKPGFWNEYVGRNVVFVFKTLEDEVRRLVWSDETEEEILGLCREYAKADFTDVKSMLLGNDFYARFFEDRRYLLAWTTTPWTLPGNMALAVSSELEYVEVEVGLDKFVLAKKLVEKALIDGKKMPGYKVLREFKGKELAGIEYDELIRDIGGGENAHKVWAAGFVGSEEGTGIVHVAPAYGEDDYVLSQEHNIPVVDVLDEGGIYTVGPYAEGDFAGKDVWTINKLIAKDLREQGKIWKIEYIQHEYPFNPRSKQRIMYRAIPSWFFDVDGSKELMIEQNQYINWFPEYLKEGRFKNNIEQAPDWNISRDRFWATAMPVWKGDKGSIRVVGSYAELKELSGVELEDYHRPWVDEVTFEIDGEKFTRIEKVLDCWFESGSMPFAQLHYPFENKEKFEKNYPADFIVEYVGQIRAWFYYVHAVNTALFGEYAYKNVITTGTVAGNDGRKMSKSLGNFTDPNELMDKFSADSLRFLLLSSPLLSGEDFALIDKDVSDVARKLAMVWNVYDFFTMYAEVDGWDSDAFLVRHGGGQPAVAGGQLSSLHLSSHIAKSFLESRQNPLDKWIVSRTHQLRNQITENMDEYNLPDAMSGILPFVDDLSNWFVRRSRRRFWKSEDDGDKAEAYDTLYYVLVYLSQVLAPFVPFMAEELYKNMTQGESVHLLDWPEAGEIDEKTVMQMAHCREVITEGLALRMRKNETEEQIKVRQPLSQLCCCGEELNDFYKQIIMDEVNVKKVVHGPEMMLDKTMTDELREEGYAREVVRVVQAARKSAGLNVDDRIRLSLSVMLRPEQLEIVQTETLATEVVQNENYAYDEIAKIDGQSVTISLEKA